MLLRRSIFYNETYRGDIHFMENSKYKAVGKFLGVIRVIWSKKEIIKALCVYVRVLSVIFLALR